MEEAAALDGAGTWRRFRSVTLPMIQPSIAIATTLTLIQGLRVFDQVARPHRRRPGGRDADARDRDLPADVHLSAVRIRRRAGPDAEPAHPRSSPSRSSASPATAPTIRRREPCSATRRGRSSIEIVTIIAAHHAAAVLDPARHRVQDRHRGAEDSALSRRPTARRSRTSSRCSRPRRARPATSSPASAEQPDHHRRHDPLPDRLRVGRRLRARPLARAGGATAPTTCSSSRSSCRPSSARCRSTSARGTSAWSAARGA